METKQNYSPIICILFAFCLLLFPFGLKAETIMHAEQQDSTEQWMPADSVFARYLQQQNIAITNNNRLELITSGREKFISLFKEVRNAKKNINLEYFNFRNDSIANALFELLAQKAKEGVEVKAMFDAFGNMSNNRPLRKRHLDKSRAEGINIVVYDPISFP